MSQFIYPAHFKHPENESAFFIEHIPTWLDKLGSLKDKPNVCLEIGALYGVASVFILENFCKLPDSYLYIMDLNINSYIENNLGPYSNLTYYKGLSEDSLRCFSHNGANKEFLDLVYIDGNHMSKHVLEDAVNSFYYLKPGGYMIFDDFGWGLEDPEHCRPKTGVEAFMHAYRAYIEQVHVGWQVILRRNGYDMTESEKTSNYYINWNKD